MKWMHDYRNVLQMRIPCIEDKISKEREECSMYDPVDDLVLVWRDACGLLVLFLSRVCVTVNLSDPWTTVGIFCGSFYDFILQHEAGFFLWICVSLMGEHFEHQNIDARLSLYFIKIHFEMANIIHVWQTVDFPAAPFSWPLYSYHHHNHNFQMLSWAVHHDYNSFLMKLFSVGDKIFHFQYYLVNFKYHW